MTLIANGDTTRQRSLTLSAALSQMLTQTQTLHLFKDGVDIGVMTRVDDFTYTRDISYEAVGDPAVIQRYMVQAQNSGSLVANSVMYEITFFDPPRAEILSIEAS